MSAHLLELLKLAQFGRHASDVVVRQVELDELLAVADFDSKGSELITAEEQLSEVGKARNGSVDGRNPITCTYRQHDDEPSKTLKRDTNSLGKR